jgi:hypothetical protein
MRRCFAACLIGCICIAGASSSSCTMSIEAIGNGGAPEVPPPVVDQQASSAFVSSASASSGGLDALVMETPPCGLFYDWDSCTVDDVTALPTSVEEAQPLLVGAWRRCNDDGTGLFPVGVFLSADGRVYRMHRMPNPFGEGTNNLLFCGEEPEDQGTWALEEGAGGGAEGIRLTVDWDDQTADEVGVVLYAEQTAWGALHGPVDTNEDTERFIPEAPSVPGSTP